MRVERGDFVVERVDMELLSGRWESVVLWSCVRAWSRNPRVLCLLRMGNLRTLISVRLRVHTTSCLRK
jgi:hypothetical protein